MWRVRLWVRVAALLVAIGAMIPWLLIVYRTNGAVENPLLISVGFVAVILGGPWLAWWPVIRLSESGDLHCRTWVKTVDTTVSSIRRIEMTEFGLRIELSDGRRITSPIFQATMSIGPPRYLEFVKAVQSHG